MATPSGRRGSVTSSLASSLSDSFAANANVTRSGSVLHLVTLPEDEEEAPPDRDHCWSWLVIHEGNPFRLFWTMIVFLLLIYTATAFLYRLAFLTFHIDEEGVNPIAFDNAGWNRFDAVVDYLFYIDLILNFFLSTRDHKGMEVDSLRQIVKKYMTGFFWLNLLACLPQEVVEVIAHWILDMEADNANTYINRIARVTRIQRVSRLARLVRMTRLAKLCSFASSSKSLSRLKSMREIRIINFIIGLLWTLHLLACFWYLCAALHSDPRETWVGRRTVDQSGTSLLCQGPFEQWLVSMYFVLTVFTTVGFGDISAGTEAEIILVAIIMVIGAVVHSIIISEVISIVTSTDNVQEYISRHHKLLDAFSDHANMPERLRRIMKDEISWRARTEACRANFNKEEMQNLITGKLLPRWLLTEMSVSLFSGELLQNNFVTCCETIAVVPPRLPLLLAVATARVEFDPGEVVYQMHDYAFNMFLVLSGTFANVGRPSHAGGLDSMCFDDDVPAQETFGSSEAAGKPRLTSRVTWRMGSSTTFNDMANKVQGLNANIVSGLKANAAAMQDILAAADSEFPASRAVCTTKSSLSLYPYRLYGSKNYFGELEMLQGVPRVNTVRCERGGTALVLAKHDFSELQEQFPHFRTAWTAKACQRERLRLYARRKLTFGLTVRHFAAVKIQNYCKARWQRLTGRPARRGSLEEETGAMVVEAMQAASSVAVTTPPSREEAAAAVHDLGKQVEDLRHGVDSMRSDFAAFRDEMRTLLRGGLSGQASSQRRRDQL